MDVGELLSYEPPKEPKRPSTEDSEEVEVKPGNKRLANLPDPMHVDKKPPKIAKTEDENKEDHDTGNTESSGEAGVLDETNLKKLILSFEKKVLKNRELRIKFPDHPEKFMDSEIELNDVIHEMNVIATQPDLYHILMELSFVTSILGLMTHENTDIAIAAVDLLQKVTDILTSSETDDATVLIDAMLEAQVVALLVQNLERLDESVKEEAEGVHNTLDIIENLIKVKPDMCIDATQQGLMQWLLKRLKAKMPCDANKLYCCETLSILLQSHEENRQYLGEIDGIDVLLQQFAYFKGHHPSSFEEHELLENLIDALCSSLMFPANREQFLKDEGLQLMNLMLREKKTLRNGALKVLDHAMRNFDGTDNCDKFVDILGLRTIFSLFMETPKNKKKKNWLPVEEHEEHLCSIFSSMLKNCKGTQRQRLLNKFTENDHEKVDRLMELHFKYLEKVHLIDTEIETGKAKLRYNDKVCDTPSDIFYLRRLEEGLFILQLIDCVMIDLCCTGPPSIKQRVLQILNLRGGSIQTIRNIMREYVGNFGDAGDPTLREAGHPTLREAGYPILSEAEQQRLLNFVDRF